MRHFINGPLTPCQALEVVRHDIILHNAAIACATLLTFLHLACICNVEMDTASPLARLGLSVPLADMVLVQHGMELMTHKLPGLKRTPVLATGQQVAQSLGELVMEQQAT
jgi:hypothetical protein